MLTHEQIERSNVWMILLIAIVVAVGGIVEIVPLFFQESNNKPLNDQVKPYDALRLAGR
ncbi:MAG: cbb3-type cytochrome c oxidase subunit II, partial [Rhodocyclaceae bacterium]